MAIKVMEIVIKGILLILLLYESYWDIKTRSVDMLCVAASLAVIIPLKIIMCVIDGEIGKFFLGMAVGVISIGLSKLTKEAIGLGDAVLIGTISVALGGEKCMKVLIIAVTAAAIYGIVLMTRMRRDKKDTMAFVPFLAGSYTIELSLIMPIILVVILLIVYMGIFNHDKAVIEHACYVSLRRAIDDNEITSEICEEIFDEEVKGGIVGKWVIDRKAEYDEEASKVMIKASSKMHMREGITTSVLRDKFLSYETEYSLSTVRGEEYIRNNAITD